MRRFLYFDCFSGISGDMVLGALIHLGADPANIRRELDKLELGNYELLSGSRSLSGVGGVDVNVVIDEDSQETDGENHKHHDHHSYREIVELIENSTLKEKVKEYALSIFREIAIAEGSVHGVETEDVHFHEVGAVDSIVDIVGTAVALDELGIERFYCSALHDGQGFIRCQHGLIPVPVPAVMEILKESGLKLVTEPDVNTEMVTPTGAGILKGIGARCRPMPEAKVLGTGYGFGSRNTGRFNALRVIMGERDDKAGADRVMVLESNLDDESGEVLAYTMDRLFGAGALDVFFTPIFMKKNRPGVKLSVLCHPRDGERLMEIILKETCTLGIRYYEMERCVLERQVVTRETPWGPVRYKISRLGNMKQLSPEYEDCARIARENGIPLSEVYGQVAEAFEF